MSVATVVLAGDVGGTKTNLGLFEMAGGRLRLLCGEGFASADFAGLGALLSSFLDGWRGPAPTAACFGVPGPVKGNASRTSNLAWEIDGGALARELGIPAVALVNDLVATAHGLPELGPDEVATLQPGAPDAAGNLALIAAGTGLGMALVPWVGGVGHAPVASEGGHMDWAPRGEAEIDLCRALAARFGHVSVERVVSGPGLLHAYEHLRDSGLAPESPQVRAALAAGEDAARVIGEEGLAGRCGICARTLDLFVSAYGAAAGNLALAGTATGGVYVGGGIAPKLLPKLAGGGFLAAFLDKGRFRPYLEAVPVHVVLDDKSALWGAARVAARLAAVS